jgi:DNA-binding transcriptional ArsR family regulator
MNIVRALGEENRVRALLALSGKELCLCQIIELLGLAPSTVSKHMAILKQARLVDTRKSGRWVFYRLAGSEAPPVVQGALAWLYESLSRDTSVLQDESCLQEILKVDLAVLCSLQGEKVNERCVSKEEPAGLKRARESEQNIPQFEE